MTAHSELIEKVKYCRRLSPGNFELLQAEIIAALSDTVQISRECAEYAHKEVSERLLDGTDSGMQFDAPEIYNDLKNCSDELGKALEAK